MLAMTSTKQLRLGGIGSRGRQHDLAAIGNAARSCGTSECSALQAMQLSAMIIAFVARHYRAGVRVFCRLSS